ncbi:helix-turn-helix domain-containing protein [Spongiimicrobium sp. 3-5]|uniref:helix-turn-helix domain-containing protein n=1 Tax=Spongiimicrobium sp. 3-5 TaxID=3332596 RepID=UPI00397EC07E
MLIIDIIGISILAIFLLFIFQKKRKMLSDYVLIITMVLISIIFISDIWVRSGLNEFNFILEKLVSFYILPTFLTYSMLLISKDNKLKKEWWWFGSFAIAFTIFILVDFVLLTDYDSEKLTTQYKTPSYLYQFFYRGGNVFVFVALLWYLNKLKQYRKKIKDDYSFIETIRLTWLGNFTWVYFINNLFVFLISLAFSFWHIGSLSILYIIVYTSIVISLFYLCYNGIRQYSLAEYESALKLNKINAEDRTAVIEEKEGNSLPKYQSSSLSEDEMGALFSKIEQLFELDKIYLEPQLKIQDLSESINVTTHNISQTINSIAQQSFYDFVNGFRVKHFKSLLSNPENRKYTILALGIESGFNSKATLNRIFKKQVGISPKEYQKAQAKD